MSGPCKYVREGAVRWTVAKKAVIAAQVAEGLRPIAEVADETGFSVDELKEMAALYERHGWRGLRARKLQMYTGRQADGDKRLRPSMMVRPTYVKG